MSTNLNLNTNTPNNANTNVNISSDFSTDFTIENFIKAVHVLYQGQNTDLKKKADDFLCDFGRKHEAWDISIQILNMKNLQEEVYYNASQIIKKKVKFDFGNHIDDTEIFKTLSEFLITKIEEFKNHKLYLLTNFCKCFAYLIMFAHQSYPEIIKILCQRLYNKDIKNLMSLLLIFNYLAENESEDDIVIDDEHRDSYGKFIHNISDDVVIFIDYLIKLLGSPGYKEEIIKADPNMLNFFRLMNKHVSWLKFIFCIL